MTDSILNAVTVVLYESQDSINIGGVVRAMKNMGVRDLRLIRPRPYDPTRVEQVAHDTRDIVERIRHFETIDEALADCVRGGILRTSAGARWARHTPRSAAVDLLEHAQVGRVAIMFDARIMGSQRGARPVARHLHHSHHRAFSLNVAQACLLALRTAHAGR